MHTAQKIVLEQRQQPVLTIETQQGLAVLGMTALELSEYVRGCVEENPFLEETEHRPPKHPLEAERRENHVNTDALLEQTCRLNRSFSGGNYGEINREFYFEKYFTQEMSLTEHLEAQLDVELCEPIDRLIAHYLVGNIDHNGYLRVQTAEVAACLNLSDERVITVLRVVQGCHPTGIAARNLRECLLLQLEASKKAGTLARLILDNHLEDVAAGHIEHIARQQKTTCARVQEVIDAIRDCNPRPGLAFGQLHNNTIWPEATVTQEGTTYVVHMQDFDLPSLKISEQYTRLAKQNNIGSDTAKYLAEQLHAARGLISGIEQRKLTIHTIASCIVELQHEFFAKGIEHLRPLTMAQVAEMAGIHESSVSRVVNGIYLQTPRGLLEMRYFFHSGLARNTGFDVSSKRVKHLLCELVKREDQAHPLSDLELQGLLAEQGITLSRRTVNKYRQSLNIPSHTRRRRFSA
jgi:RNA polymerase sigma-54 factor